MWNRQTVTCRGRSQTLAAQEHVQDLALPSPRSAAELGRDRLESATLLSRWQAEHEIVLSEKLAELHGSLGAMLRPRGSRCGIGRSTSAAGTTIESMHHGQRDAALGRDRLQERQTRFDRN